MRYLLRSATMLSAVALGATAAQAADLTYEPAPVVEAPAAFNWTGFYVGVHGGIGGGDFDTQFRYYDSPSFNVAAVDAAALALSPYGYNLSDNAFGAFGGAQIGYNWQFATNWVAGVEADIAASGIKSDYRETDVPDGSTWGVETKVDWFGTIRGRLGYAWDNVLFYGTGGAAYGKVKFSGSESYCGDGCSNYGTSGSETNWGWTAGAGIEYGITKNITLKTEYLYVDLGNFQVDGGDFAYGQFDTDIAFHTLKAGLNYKF